MTWPRVIVGEKRENLTVREKPTARSLGNTKKRANGDVQISVVCDQMIYIDPVILA